MVLKKKINEKKVSETIYTGEDPLSYFTLLALRAA